MAAQDTGTPGVDDPRTAAPGANPETTNPETTDPKTTENLREQAGAETRSAFARQQHLAADSLGTVAQALHQAAGELKRQNRGFAGRTVDDAATRVDHFADSLRGRDLDGLVDEVEAYARRRPALFMGATVAAGLVIARVLQNSHRRHSLRRTERAREARILRDLDARIARDHAAWSGSVGDTAGYRGTFNAAAGPAETGGGIYSPATGFAAGADTGAGS